MRTIIPFITSILLVFTACAQPNQPLVYKLKIGAKYEKGDPVIVLLHGYGSNENDLISLAGTFGEEVAIISFRAPNVVRTNSFAWYSLDWNTTPRGYNGEEARKSLALIEQNVHDVIKTNHLTEDHLYFMGFSQGAIMSMYMAFTKPNWVEGIAVLSGRLLKEAQTDISTDKFALKELKVFVSHGTADPVIEVSEAKATANFLESIGINPKVVYRDGVGHSIDQATLDALALWFRKCVSEG